MIDVVRRTVLSVLNKENNGYITPDQFNLYARQAQLEIFEQYFYDLNIAQNRQNRRLNHSGHGDIRKRMEETIDSFTQPFTLQFNGITQRFSKPEDCYHLGTLFRNDLTTEIEIVPHKKIGYIVNSMEAAPDLDFPVGTVIGNEIRVYPDSINVSGEVVANYVRYPKDPKWTYNTVGESPVFNPSSSSYQDFELPKDDENNLIIRILLYCGVEIRDPQIVQTAKTEENQEKQEQK